MSEVNIDQQPLPDPNELYNRGKMDVQDVRNLRISDGRVRIENGAFIVSDEEGIDRVLIGFGEGLF